jgi:Fe-Mn family superoxide dismutase
MAFELPSLPYADDALAASGLSAQTISFHHGKHHKAYVDNLNNLVKDTDLADKTIEEVIKISHKEGKAGIFNNAAQVWNHTFYWNGIKPAGGGAPTGALLEAINSSFGSFDNFKAEFKNAALTQFGSGWAWLVAEGGALKITKTPNAENPLTVEGQTPLLTIDVWEHAYYLDFQNSRPNYIQNYIDNLINWDVVAANFAAA